LAAWLIYFLAEKLL